MPEVKLIHSTDAKMAKFTPGLGPYFLLCLSHSLEKGNIEFSRYFILVRETANFEQKQE